MADENKQSGKNLVKDLPREIAINHAFNGANSVSLPVDSVLRSDAVHPKAPGPWSAEADKIAWFDRSTGYGCIIRRAAQGGHLCGYIGIGPDHPAFGFAVSALRGLGLKVHGGLNYAAECERHEEERHTRTPVYQPGMAICHERISHYNVRQHTTKAGRTVAQARPEHDDLWWIGFECNQPTDVLPTAGKAGSRIGNRSTSAEGTAEREYRNEAYVLDQWLWLAEQLKAIELGGRPEDAPARWTPPLGFDTRNGGVGR